MRPTTASLLLASSLILLVAPGCATTSPPSAPPADDTADASTSSAPPEPSAPAAPDGPCDGGPCAPAPTRTCGADLAARCADGEACEQDLDCASDYCDGAPARCAPPPPAAHEDGRRNAGETGKDCGGAAAAVDPNKTCGEGEPCKVSSDCTSTCTQGRCDAPGPTDGKRNDGETDVDCGGPNAPGCMRGKACGQDADCLLLACAAGTCATPAADDGVRSGGETDVDCGGDGVAEDGFAYKAPRCVDHRACTADADCQSGACSPGGSCVPRSCDTAESAGITTCGALEVGNPVAVHESCCKSLRLPTRTTRRLDKYEITAGRFRSFLTAVGPNVRQWVSAYVAANPSSQLAALLTTGPVVEGLYPASMTGTLGLVAHMAFDIDNYGGIRGCYNSDGGYGHNTYWQPADALDEFGIPARPLPREITDAKPLNCAMPMMYMAFCAWDGGELATLADYRDAWGSPTRYPWGAADIGRPNYNWCNGEPGTGGFTCQDTNLGVNGAFYRFPADTDLAKDLSPYIAAPGRFTNDATANQVNGESWQDLFANLAEYTGDLTASATQYFCDFSGAPLAGATTCTRALKVGSGTKYVGIPNVGIVGRSWEGHNYAGATSPGSVNAFAATFQYGKFGGRCVRPAP